MTSGHPAGSRVLLTNHALVHRCGSELFVRDLAQQLQRRGDRPMIYSPVLGAVARDLAAAGIPVVDDLDALPAVPDVIHAQHHVPAMTAMLRFPGVPVVFVCHGAVPWEEAPPVFPSLRDYVAVDDACRERIEATPGTQGARITTIYNSVDLARFGRRGPLPPRPRRALVFSNYATEASYLPAVRNACRDAGIEQLDVIGLGSGASCAEPEAVLPQYDLVFAKARCALEALAVGAAVIVLDVQGMAGLVTPSTMAAWRRLNFGFRLLSPDRLAVSAIRAEIDRYDPQASAAVTDWIREQAADTTAVDAYRAVYEQALGDRQPWDAETARLAGAAASLYLGTLGRSVTDQLATARRAAEAHRQAHQVLEQALVAAEQKIITAERTIATMEQTTAEIRRRLSDIENSRTWRIFAPYRRLRRGLRSTGET